MNAKEPSFDEIRRRLDAELKRRGWTRRHLAERARIGTAHISNFMRGERGATVFTLVKYARALGVSLDWLVTGEHPSQGRVPEESEGIRQFLSEHAELLSPWDVKRLLSTHIDPDPRIPLDQTFWRRVLEFWRRELERIQK